MNFMHDGTTESVDSIPHLNDGRLNDVAVTIYAYNPTVV
jgi:hypothetical protein